MNGISQKLEIKNPSTLSEVGETKDKGGRSQSSCEELNDPLHAIAITVQDSLEEGKQSPAISRPSSPTLENRNSEAKATLKSELTSKPEEQALSMMGTALQGEDLSLNQMGSSFKSLFEGYNFGISTLLAEKKPNIDQKKLAALKVKVDDLKASLENDEIDAEGLKSAMSGLKEDEKGLGEVFSQELEKMRTQNQENLTTLQEKITDYYQTGVSNDEVSVSVDSGSLESAEISVDEDLEAVFDETDTVLNDLSKEIKALAAPELAMSATAVSALTTSASGTLRVAKHLLEKRKIEQKKAVFEFAGEMLSTKEGDHVDGKKMTQALSTMATLNLVNTTDKNLNSIVKLEQLRELPLSEFAEVDANIKNGLELCHQRCDEALGKNGFSVKENSAIKDKLYSKLLDQKGSKKTKMFRSNSGIKAELDKMFRNLPPLIKDSDSMVDHLKGQLMASQPIKELGLERDMVENLLRQAMFNVSHKDSGLHIVQQGQEFRLEIKDDKTYRHQLYSKMGDGNEMEGKATLGKSIVSSFQDEAIQQQLKAIYTQTSYLNEELKDKKAELKMDLLEHSAGMFNSADAVAALNASLNIQSLKASIQGFEDQKKQVLAELEQFDGGGLEETVQTFFENKKAEAEIEITAEKRTAAINLATFSAGWVPAGGAIAKSPKVIALMATAAAKQKSMAALDASVDEKQLFDKCFELYNREGGQEKAAGLGSLLFGKTPAEMKQFFEVQKKTGHFSSSAQFALQVEMPEEGESIADRHQFKKDLQRGNDKSLRKSLPKILKGLDEEVLKGSQSSSLKKLRTVVMTTEDDLFLKSLSSEKSQEQLALDNVVDLLEEMKTSSRDLMVSKDPHKTAKENLYEFFDGDEKVQSSLEKIAGQNATKADYDIFNNALEAKCGLKLKCDLTRGQDHYTKPTRVVIKDAKYLMYGVLNEKTLSQAQKKSLMNAL